MVLVAVPGTAWSAENSGFIEGDRVVVQFTESHEGAAREILRMVPTVRAELEDTFVWRLDFDSRVVLSEDHASFQSRVGNDLVVAYAVPQQRLIVFDSSLMNKSPFSIGVTLKHELCHLLLHHRIAAERLPRWLDEGIAQWISGGIAEILTGGGDAVLDQAALSRTLIPMDGLAKSFPRDQRSFRLAYEESRSFVEFMVGNAGNDGLRNILDHLGTGSSIDDAVFREFGYTFGELERNWQRSLEDRMTWMAYLSRHLYAILFFLTGLITVFGFMRLLVRKRAYKDDEEIE